MAAVELLHGEIPAETKLAEGFARLSARGLIAEKDGAFTLTPAAEKLMEGQRRSAETPERIFMIKDKLAAYVPPAEFAAAVVAPWQLTAAIAAHRASGAGAGRNMLVPKPKAAEPEKKRSAQWSKRAPGRRR